MKLLYEEMIGKKYGRLTVLDNAGLDKTGHRLLKCQCDCGNTVIVYQQSLRSGIQVSCGCFKQEQRMAQKPRLQNEYDLSGEYGIGYTHNNHQPFYFDLEDFEKIKDYCWREDRNGYIVANKEKRETILLHRLVCNFPENMDVDHISHELFDNRKERLRVVEHHNNLCNAKVRTNNTSGYTGISYNKQIRKWEVYITYKKERVRLGYFLNISDAIAARETAEEKYFGEYSFKNSINTQQN